MQINPATTKKSTTFIVLFLVTHRRFVGRPRTAVIAKRTSLLGQLSVSPGKEFGTQNACVVQSTTNLHGHKKKHDFHRAFLGDPNVPLIELKLNISLIY